MLNVPNNVSQVSNSNQDSRTQIRPRPSSSMIQNNNQTTNTNSKFNFIPQIFESQNDCKKIRKSGLTLLKMNQPSQKGESSRIKLNMSSNGQQ